MSDCAGSWQEQLIIKIWTWSILPPLCQHASKGKILRISCSQICMQCCKCLFLQLSLCCDSLHDHEQGRGCCPLPGLQLQSLVSCMMKWVITTAAWKNIIWLCSQLFPYRDWFVIAFEDRLCIQSTMQLSAFRPPCWKAWGIQEINRDKLITTLANGNSVWPELL